MYYSRVHNTSLAQWHVLLAALLVSFAVAYVWQMNSQARHAFSMREMEEARAVLQGEIRDLNWELAKARSLAAVASRAEGLRLATPKEVTYVHMGFSTVAAYGSPVSP